MATATITSKGQVTIPKEIRDAAGLASGARVNFRLRADGLVEMQLEAVDLLDLFGALKPQRRGVTVDEMQQAIVAAAVRQ